MTLICVLKQVGYFFYHLTIFICIPISMLLSVNEWGDLFLNISKSHYRFMYESVDAKALLQSKTEPETFLRVFAPGKQTCAATYRIISLAWPYSKYTARRAFMHTKLFSALIITISADKLSIYPLFTALRIKILIHPVLNMMLRIFQFWLKFYYFNMIVFNDSVMFHLEIHWH